MNKYVTEFIGTFFLVIGAVFGGALGASLVLMVMVYAGGHISGAHYNPAVTFAIWMRGKMLRKDVLFYWISQLLGAIAAACLAVYFFGVEGNGECAIPADGMTTGIIAELLGTFVLAYVVLNVGTSKETAGNSFFGLAIAASIMAMAYTIGKYSGAGYNPAVFVALGIQKTFCWDHWWIYLVGNFGGASLAAIVFSFCNPTDE
ncbi:MAG TPA: aquaporin [Ferruginibacter sp.]|nr:aquaporin [Ferruginibacter sp.]